ncbi:hypothetical protein [Psychrobacter lutiphocae]|uniref:hypothetical protein n=1 Tax=Psychrobacter lutiphocae TaxID=540500 RepID=UPI00035CCD2E|nr:hypothetical protein [Psychrobacter lutiphocae]
MAITQSPASDKSYKSFIKKGRAVAGFWLIMALVSGAAAIAIWMFTIAPEDSEAQQQEPTPEVVAFNIGQVTQIDKLDELSEDVHPISYDALIRDLRDYPPEFKDATYLKKNKGKWTLQVMDVSEHDIISDYLNLREDREKFAYFRYRDVDDKPRYLLTYGVMSSETVAKSEMANIDFELPANVHVIPEKMDAYLEVIENYELSVPIKDLSSNRVRQVKLQPTQSELAARRREKEQQLEDSHRQSAEQDRQQLATERNIKTSNDSSDTLSVQEQRRVVVPDSQHQENRTSTTASNGQASTSEPQGATRPKVDEPERATPPKPADNTNVDPIKQLIDEKTQQ